MSSVYNTAFNRARERREKANAKVEMAIPVVTPEKEILVGCPDSFAGNLQINRHCRLQPVEYQKYGGEIVVSYQLCGPKGYLENWNRCPFR